MAKYNQLLRIEEEFGRRHIMDYKTGAVDADQLLRQFHAGVRARQLRHQHGVDPWDVVSRHRNLPVAQYHEVAAILNVAGVQG